MLIYGTIQYVNDESTSIVDSKAFHATEDDIYPTMTVCLELDQKMKKWHEPGHRLPLYNEILDSNKRKDYLGFLLGNNTNGINNLMDVNYDEATFDLNDYVERVAIRSGDKILYEGGLKGSPSKSKPFFVSYRHPLVKCFSIDISNAVPDAAGKGTAISSFEIEFGWENPIFNKKAELVMSYFLHYPNQLMRSTALERDHLGITYETFQKIFLVDNMEVIRKRNTRFRKCNENYKEEDDLIRQRLVEKVGCTPIHWPIEKDYKDRCKSADEMIQLGTPLLESINPEFFKTFKDEEPCNQIYAIAYTFKDLHPPPFCSELTNSPKCKDPKEKGGPQGNTHDNSSTKPEAHVGQDKITNEDEPECPMMCRLPPTKTISVGFKSFNYKEIKHIKAFTIESWVGNVGGYIGLFLGCAIWQVPDFIEFLFKKLRGIVNKNSGLRNKLSPFVYGNKN